MLPEKIVTEIRAQLFQGHYANLEENCFIQAWDVHMLMTTENEYQESCIRAEKEIAEIEKTITSLKEKKDKLSRDQYKNMVNFILPTRKLMYQKMKIARSDMYKEIVARADKIDEGKEKLEFRKAFNSFIPKLPFIEIEGTKYESTETNEIKLDEKGVKVLYIKNDAKPKTEEKNNKKA